MSALTACLSYATANHDDCPSSVECFHAVLTEPADLIAAVLEVANPGTILEATVAETLRSLVLPGRVVAFRTESGSLYEATIYTAMLSVGSATGHRVQLHKIVDDRPVLMAEGIAKIARDPKRGVVGVLVDEPSGRYVRTSAVTSVWLAYDATI